MPSRPPIELVELAPGLWKFWERRFGIPPSSTAYALHDGEDTIFVDPLARGDADPVLEALDGIVRGRVRILITIPFHVRGAEVLWRRWRDRREVTIYGHEQCASRLDDRSALHTLSGGETLEGGIRAHRIGNPKRSEIPYELPSHSALAFGDTVLVIDGRLRVWADVGTDRRRAFYEQRLLPTLEPLTRLGTERLLVTHGEPVLHGGARELRAAFGRPWDRKTAGPPNA